MIVTILVASAIVAIGLGLGLGLRDRSDSSPQLDTATTPQPTTTKSPLYNPPSKSEEGRYRFAAVAADAKECSQIGT